MTELYGLSCHQSCFIILAVTHKRWYWTVDTSVLLHQLNNDTEGVVLNTIILLHQPGNDTGGDVLDTITLLH